MRVQRNGKDPSEDMYSMDTNEQVAVHMCGFGDVQENNYFVGKPVRTQVKVKIGKLTNGKAAAKDEVTQK